MRTIKDIDGVRMRRKSVVTIGSFDGIHLGHRRILSEVAMLARGLCVTGAVVTFDPHPMAVLHPKEAPCLLTTPAEKTKLMGETGVSHMIVMRFTVKLAKRPAEWFVRDILLERLNMRRLVIGYDFRFGASREGDAPYLEHLGGKLGFGVDIVPPVNYLGHPVSSTRVRTALVRGDVEAAASMLGRPYRFTGRVVKGEGRGRMLDFPTANLEAVEPGKALPASGVYAAEVELGKRRAAGALYIGTKPTFRGEARSIEVHIIGLKGTLYGRKVKVSFLKRLRGDAAFPDPQALKAAIAEDVGRVRRLFST